MYIYIYISHKMKGEQIQVYLSFMKKKKNKKYLMHYYIR